MVTASTMRGRILLLVLLASLAGGARAAAGVRVSIELVELAAGGAPLEVLLVAEPADSGREGSEDEVIEQQVEPGFWQLDLPPGRRWRLRAMAPGYTSNEVWIDPARAGRTAELFLWRAGVLRGLLSSTAPDGLPKTVDLRLEGDAFAPPAGGPRSTVVRCPVIDGTWECEVPAGTLDLVLWAKGFASHRRQGILVEPGRVRDLGTIPMQSGASIVGRVELEGGGQPGRRCRVRLESSAAGRSRRESLPAVGVQSDGRFEFEGISAGRYVLKASDPDYLSATSDEIEVLTGDSVEIAEPLLLRPRAALELVFIPPTGPEGRNWQFHLYRADAAGGRSGDAVRGEAEPDGTWVKEDLVPGVYELTLRGDLASQELKRRFELPGGWSNVLIELSLVMVEGQVLLGDEPVAAKVTLSQSEEKSSTTFESDEWGVFSGLLPREGRWQVGVEVPAEGIGMELEAVEVWDQTGSGVAVVEIRLPDTVLEVEVTDRLGSPMAEATVSVRHGGPFAESRGFTTDTEGWLRIRGLEPGAISVMATAGDMRSQWIDLILYEDRAEPALQIVVR